MSDVRSNDGVQCVGKLAVIRLVQVHQARVQCADDGQ